MIETCLRTYAVEPGEHLVPGVSFAVIDISFDYPVDQVDHVVGS